MFTDRIPKNAENNAFVSINRGRSSNAVEFHTRAPYRRESSHTGTLLPHSAPPPFHLKVGLDQFKDSYAAGGTPLAITQEACLVNIMLMVTHCNFDGEDDDVGVYYQTFSWS